MMNKRQHERAEDADMLAAEKAVDDWATNGATDHADLFLAGCKHKEAEMRGEIDRLHKAIELRAEAYRELDAKLAASEEKSKAIAAALEWYADPDNYVGAFSHDGCATNADENCGLKAREALAKYAGSGDV